MRRDLGRWLRDAGAGSEVVEMVQMACHEACSNAIEHGYSFGDGVLHVDADQDAVRRIHGRVRQLLGIHLAETLEPADLQPRFRQLERRFARR